MRSDLTKRFWLFGIRIYYPEGGLEDVKFTANELSELVDFYKIFHDEELQEDKAKYFTWWVYDSEEFIYSRFYGYII